MRTQHKSLELTLEEKLSHITDGEVPKEVADLILQLKEENIKLKKEVAELESATKFCNTTGVKLRQWFDRNDDISNYSNIVFADVNLLKPANDHFGHDAGDALLRSVGEVVSNTIRDDEEVYRWGGDEFVIFLKTTTLDDIKLSFSQNPSFKFTDKGGIHDIKLSVSLGEGHSIKEAEEKMYEDKKNTPRYIEEAQIIV